jgi:DNA-binding transcriptional ArsR family regulator
MDEETNEPPARTATGQPVADTDGCLVRGADPERVARGRELLLDDDIYFQIAETFRTLADSSRAKIIYSLLRQELCTCELAAITGNSDSAVSQHLRVLRQLRLVKSQRRGKMVYYSLDDGHIRLLLSVCLSHIRDGSQQPQGLDGIIALFAQAG